MAMAMAGLATDDDDYDASGSPVTGGGLPSSGGGDLGCSSESSGFGLAAVWRAWWTARRHLRSDLFWPVQPVVVVIISFVGGGRPETGWSDLEILHIVPAASREDIVAGENRADGR